MHRFLLRLFALIFWLIPSAAFIAAHAAEPVKALPLPGGSFLVDGHASFVIPAASAEGGGAKPWVWYAPTLPGLPGPEERWMFERFLDAGIAVAGIDVGESYGSPDGRALFSRFHDEMTRKRGYASKPVLLGRSRGGLMTLAWAAENPEKVAGFAAIYPVCDIASYPGVAKAAPAYGMDAAQLQAHLAEHNPVDRLAALARAKVPLFAIHGDVDALVPLAANSGLVKQRYDALGGTMRLVVPAGQGHNMWTGFFQCQELVDFVVARAAGPVVLTSPLEHQVVQRSSRRKGTIPVRGTLASVEGRRIAVEARVVVAGKAGKWRRIPLDRVAGTFAGEMEAPAGGWHRLEARVSADGKVVAGTTVAHVGVGEVFVVAGQSNSANHGEEKQTVRSGRVVAFDGRRWSVADDPQPGASGGGGSFLPPFGDAIAAKFDVPVGWVACGSGGTSVREWLPKGARFPGPPTVMSHVTRMPEGDWSCDGALYGNLVDRMASLGPRGFRAVLWHQGESDANQADPTRTLSGPLYREFLVRIIRDSRRAIGWEPPWFVAQVSYHVPGDEASPEIRAAQASLWRDRVALEGPDTDALKGALRDGGGKGVHFSGSGLRAHAASWAEKVSPWLARQLR